MNMNDVIIQTIQIDENTEVLNIIKAEDLKYSEIHHRRYIRNQKMNYREQHKVLAALGDIINSFRNNYKFAKQ